MILHIPHSSKFIPQDIRPQLSLSDPALAAELIDSTDSYTDDLFDGIEALRVVFPISRLVVDPERFTDDEQEPMSRSGRGVIYTRTSRGDILRQFISPYEKTRLLKQYYRPHHALLARYVKEELEKRKSCLIVDCHSFPSNPLPCDPDKSPDRPEICLGTDSYHTPVWFFQGLEQIFKNQGFKVEFNRPYCGSIVPQEYYHTNPDVVSIMIEVNRGLYMDEATGLKKESFEGIHIKIVNIMSSLLKMYRCHFYV